MTWAPLQCKERPAACKGCSGWQKHIVHSLAPYQPLEGVESVGGIGGALGRLVPNQRLVILQQQQQQQGRAVVQRPTKDSRSPAGQRSSLITSVIVTTEGT